MAALKVGDRVKVTGTLTIHTQGAEMVIPEWERFKIERIDEDNQLAYLIPDDKGLMPDGKALEVSLDDIAPTDD